MKIIMIDCNEVEFFNIIQLTYAEPTQYLHAYTQNHTHKLVNIYTHISIHTTIHL